MEGRKWRSLLGRVFLFQPQPFSFLSLARSLSSQETGDTWADCLVAFPGELRPIKKVK